MMNVMLIGEAKSGKTVALETLIKGTVVFSFDKGGWHSLGRRGKKVITTSTLREWLKVPQVLQANEILVVDYEVKNPIQDGMLPKYDDTLLHQFILDANELWLPNVKERGIYHVALDSLTGLQYPVLDYVVTLGQRGKGTSQYEYGIAIEKMKEIIDSFVDMPLDFILTSHIEAEKDDITGKVKEQPLIYGKKLPGLILSKMDDIYFTYTDTSTGKLEFWWGTQPQMFLKIIGQRNFDNLPIRLKPNFAEVYKDKLCS